MITKEPWEIFFEGVEQLSDKFLRRRAGPTQNRITRLIAGFGATTLRADPRTASPLSTSGDAFSTRI